MKYYRYIFIMVIMVVFTGCGEKAQNESKRYSENKSLMGTIIQLDICLDQELNIHHKKAMDQAWGRLKEISWRMNVYDQQSDVTKVNNSFSMPVQIKGDTYDILKRSVEFAHKTEGAFLISVRPLIELWGAYQKENIMPPESEIKEILKKIDLDQLVFFPNNIVQVKNETIKLDLGGNAKGYAIDEVARIFRENNIENFYIDAGGDVYVGGLNCKGELWTIGIRDPRSTNKIINTVSVSNKAVTTSGNYEQYFVINNQKFSHIINPQTGYPQQDVVSATVIANTAELADVYSTALTVLGRDGGTALIDNNKEEMASIIYSRDTSGRLVLKASQKFEKFYLKK